ncbi:hypothetical protein R5R35_007225 [Gryllus longicercus]|uniref:Bifunctional coenzyme A synthase n=2 Tax=Gryllus longicercus TaxID=2509291 RepID=A0AAN9Z0Y6_9ORTH
MPSHEVILILYLQFAAHACILLFYIVTLGFSTCALSSMAKTGLLILTNPSTINHVLPIAKKYVGKTLYVHLSQQRHLIPPWISKTDTSFKPPNFRKIVVGIYSQTMALCQNLDVRILLSSIKYPLQKSIETKQKIDVVIFDKKYSCDEVHNFMQSYLTNKNTPCEVVTINETSKQNHNSQNVLNENDDYLDFSQLVKDDSKIYDNVVLGGTFDRLHSGHKILLSEALLHCSKRLTVGVTDLNMLKSKKLWELIEPCEKRISDVHDFLADVDCELQYNIVPISDPFGPTKEDPNLQMIVVSSETFRGGQKVNELREQKGLSVLDILKIDMLETVPLDESVEETKVSSSNYRIRLLGQRLREPELKTHIPLKPYLIGLTGCIGSGKSSIGKRLEGLGAGVVNCDALAHILYRKGQPCYLSLIEHFGRQILDDQEEVNRRVLGSIVFNDKEQLAKLNSLLWPAILGLAKEEALKLFKKGHDVVVLDAAVLLQAGWDNDCHEVWACIIPPEEAVRRIQARNNLSKEDAESRISAQPSNLEMVSQAHVVLCTLWEPEYTQKQVQKAWDNLQNFLKVRGKL